jgi:hypothetical protein
LGTEWNFYLPGGLSAYPVHVDQLHQLLRQWIAAYYVGGCNASTTGSAQQRLNDWFNTACFVAPPSSTFGNLGRTFTTVRTAGIANYDFSLFKAIAVRERLNIQFRTEFFNIFNRVQFGLPGEVQGNSQFGLVTTQLNLPQLVQFALRMN